MKRLALYTGLVGIAFLAATGKREEPAVAETRGAATAPDTLRWHLAGNGGILWQVSEDARLPHNDHLEMSGRKVSVIVQYGVDADRNLVLSREVYWPTLRTAPQPGEPDWYKYRAYLKRKYGAETGPQVRINGKPLSPGPVQSVELNGVLTIHQAAGPGVALKRTLFPSATQGAVLERWELTNTGKTNLRVAVAPLRQAEEAAGIYDTYRLEVYGTKVPEKTLPPGKKMSFAVAFTARKESEPAPNLDVQAELRGREQFVQTVTRALVLTTPDSTLNRAFRMAKIRAAESIFDTKVGPVHSPGGGRYYGGVWANDQVEYAGPFFPFLGYDLANAASLNAYRIFARDMKPDYGRIWASHEMEGDLPCCSRDRGDAAMYAYGAARFALATGSPEVGKELWPAVAWSLEYCRRRTNADGVVESESDEMEGRLPTGKANLSTSTLAYGGLRSGADLARAVGQPDSAAAYEERAEQLKAAIERHFGATVEGFRTYQYFRGHDTLRHWICLPLAMGITDRREGTVRALFSRLWTANGLEVQPGANSFWDRGTLYALRGVYTVGETALATQHLTHYTRQRLLGNHVPYPVEAYPEGGQAHLSAESALYGRVVTEGLFGITPTGFRSFRCTPRLPAAWPGMQLSRIKAFGEEFDLSVRREGAAIRLQVLRGGQSVFSQSLPDGSTFEVDFRQ
ncbi:MAG: six-hairpin glycosidase-like protein [Cytophagales bacterium]|nr:six-hairpin glycosidase-like protein [Cytophagales bacterium]